MVTKTLCLSLLVGAAVYAAPAFACPVLKKADPRVGSEVDTPPPQVSLHFSGPIDVTKSTLEIKDAEGRSVVTGALIGTGNPVDTIAAPVKLSHGKYKVLWHIHCNCEDGMDSVYPGDYSFTVR